MNNSPLAQAFASLNENEVAKLISSKIESGMEPISIVKELQAGMNIFGERYKKGDFFIADLIIAGEIFQQSMKLLEPLLQVEAVTNRKTGVILGTVKGDIHNLGKDILGLLLKASGFEVYDLGINVPPSTFVNKLAETRAPILGLSGLITPSFESMKETVQAVAAAGLRNRVKVIIGGGVVDELVKNYTGADAFSTDALEGVQICKRFAEGAK
jgi:5-methyltetrahydrofolate--homocysteine methyltransferase